jgi:carbon storage regulator
MLVLTRKIGEKVVIGDSIVVTVLEASKNKVRIGILAPSDIPILREELAFAGNVIEESRDSVAFREMTAVCAGTTQFLPLK